MVIHLSKNLFRFIVAAVAVAAAVAHAQEAPTGVRAGAGNAGFVVEWDAPTTPTPPVTAYEICVLPGHVSGGFAAECTASFRKRVSVADVAVVTTDLDTTTYINYLRASDFFGITVLVNGEDYRYAVRAAYATSSSEWVTADADDDAHGNPIGNRTATVTDRRHRRKRSPASPRP